MIVHARICPKKGLWKSTSRVLIHKTCHFGQKKHVMTDHVRQRPHLHVYRRDLKTKIYFYGSAYRPH